MAVSPNVTFEAFLARTRTALDSELIEWLRLQRWSEDFDQALRHVLLGAGKALRPALVFAMAESLSGRSAFSSESLRRLALSIELMHTYSLIHDDLPAMDDDAFRRGRPTLHVLHGEAFAILAGDALLTASFQCLGEAFRDQPEKLAPALSVLSRAGGPTGMIGGQWLDMSSSARLADEAYLEFTHRMKTGALLSASAVLGAMQALSPTEFSKVEDDVCSWSQDLGLVFQMVDDLLDSESTKEELGKTPGKDVDSEKLTYLSLMGREKLKNRIHEMSEALGTPGFAPSSSLLAGCVAFVAQRSS
jgi:geranylgeranyl pyrophosphate synthase